MGDKAANGIDDILEDDGLNDEIIDDDGGNDPMSAVIDDDDDNNDGGKGPKEMSVEDLKAQIDALAKEKDGIYKEMISERRTRQELKNQLENISQVINELKNRKSESADSAGKKTIGGIPVQFDDDGNPFIDPNDLAPVVESTVAPVKEEVTSIKDSSFSQEIENENARIINSIVQEDPTNVIGYKMIQDAWKFLDKNFDKVLAQTGIDPSTLTIDMAAELIEDSDLADEFAQQFPGLDIDLVIDANVRSQNGLVSARKLKKAVRTAVQAAGKAGNEKINKLKLLANKPSNLSGQPNRKGGGGRTLNDIADISVDDFMNLSDADVAKLERALRNAET